MTLFKEFPFLPATALEMLWNETVYISVINVKMQFYSAAER